jgi:hypothetical protein
MQFEVRGPYFLATRSIIRSEHVAALYEELAEDPRTESLLYGCGCYVFGIKSSGSKRVVPWYVGRAERQSLIAEATNRGHLQLYNEILDDYKKGQPALFFLPAVTQQAKPRAPTSAKRGVAAVRFLEDWLISVALKQNRNLYNVQNTKMLRELYVRGIFNPKKGDRTTTSSDLRYCLGL